LNPELPILGYTDTETVKLDFDDIEFKKAKQWALKAMNWFKLEGFVILKSSEKHYHIVFNRTVSWIFNLHVVAWVGLQSKNEGLRKWFLMQCIKENSTLRISTKKTKRPPRIIYRHKKQGKQIKDYLEWRQLIKEIDKKRKIG